MEPTWSSALAAHGIASVLRETRPTAVMVSNKARNPGDAADVEEIARQARLPLIGVS